MENSKTSIFKNTSGSYDICRLATRLAKLQAAEVNRNSKKSFSIDIEDVVDRVQGRCTVLGNLDAVGVLEQADEEHLRAEIARQIAAGRRNGSRFIMSLGSPVTPGTPAERVRLYCDLAHELGGA